MKKNHEGGIRTRVSALRRVVYFNYTKVPDFRKINTTNLIDRPLLTIQIRKHNILAATRSMMIGEVLAFSFAVPAISLANWPMAFLAHHNRVPYVSFSRPENQNNARRHYLAQVAKSPILRFNYG